MRFTPSLASFSTVDFETISMCLTDKNCLILSGPPLPTLNLASVLQEIGCVVTVAWCPYRQFFNQCLRFCPAGDRLRGARSSLVPADSVLAIVNTSVL